MVCVTGSCCDTSWTERCLSRRQDSRTTTGVPRAYLQCPLRSPRPRQSWLSKGHGGFPTSFRELAPNRPNEPQEPWEPEVRRRRGQNPPHNPKVAGSNPALQPTDNARDCANDRDSRAHLPCQSVIKRQGRTPRSGSASDEQSHGHFPLGPPSRFLRRFSRSNFDPAVSGSKRSFSSPACRRR